LDDIFGIGVIARDAIRRPVNEQAVLAENGFEFLRQDVAVHDWDRCYRHFVLNGSTPGARIC
jgi:hypothetical protein